VRRGRTIHQHAANVSGDIGRSFSHRRDDSYLKAS
jgi:hypothetical protein